VFYIEAKSVDELVDHAVDRALGLPELDAPGPAGATPPSRAGSEEARGRTELDARPTLFSS
jgi:hypothetical protein